MATGFPGAARDPRVDALVQNALQLMQQRRLDDAARAWNAVLSASPDHPQALLHLGQHQLYRGDAMGALPLLHRAAEANPKDPAVFLNLSFAYRALGNSDQELAALQGALAIDAYFFPALLAKGAVLEKTGKTRQAADAYKNALLIAPPEDQLPEAVKTAMARARKAIADNRAELDKFLSDRFGSKRAAHNAQEMSRFDQCRDAVIGKGKIYTQQPTMLHFPGLPAMQYYDRALFPWLARLEEATPFIREELINVMREDDRGFAPYVNYPAGVPLNQWADLNLSPKWSAFFFWKNAVKNEENCARCPRTAEFLRTLPYADIPDFAPTFFFSSLQAKTLIPAHTGVTNARLTVHLPLIVPPGGCWFRVGNETREWEEGKAWVFDDTIEHEAYNPTDKLRVILIFDTWNPHLTPAEREMVSELLSSLYAYYDTEFTL